MKRKVERFLFQPLVESPDYVGILGTFVVVIDGVGHGPFLAMRQLDAKVHTSYVTPFEQLRIPECLLEKQVRARIEEMVAKAIEQWKARA